MFYNLSLGKSRKNNLLLEALETRIVPAIDPTNALFVENTFYNILSRGPNAEELATFSTNLDNGYSREAFVSDMWRSEPHRTLQITEMFRGFLNRELNAGDDLAAKIVRMNTNDLLEIDEKNPLSAENKELKAIFTSAEYASLHPTNPDFVTSLYRLLNHQPDLAEVNGHIASIEAFGTDISGGRAAVVDAVLTGSEYEFKSIARLYQSLLHRNPDSQEIENPNFMSQLNSNSIREEIVRISTSAEGQALGNIEQVYVSVTAPSGDIKEGDLAFFTVTLSRPASREVTVNYVTTSDEAISGSDFELETGTLVFAIGETVKTVGINTVEDFIGEATESFDFLLGSSLGAVIPGTQEAWEEPQGFVAILGASADDPQKGLIAALMNKIRSVETFSDPKNPGKIVAGLRPNNYPDPNAKNNPAEKTSGTLGHGTYPGDARNTPGAYQSDLVNMNGLFGIWKGVAGSAKASNPENTQFAFNKTTLNEYFGIQVDEKGFIQSIGPDAASIFLQNDSLANSESFNPSRNPLIGQNIENFKYQQLSLFLAGRLADDSTAGSTSLAGDPRIATDSVQERVERIQLESAKAFLFTQFLEALKNNSNNVADYGPGGFANVEALYGSKIQITSTLPGNILGVTKDQVFWGTFNPAFLDGYGYVGGFYGLRPVLKAMLAADAVGTSNYPDIRGESVTITRTMEGSTKVFSFNRTPINIDETYPSFLHYGALMSQFTEINNLNATDWGFSPTPFDMGYETIGTQTTANIIGTATLPNGSLPNAYKVEYTGLALDQTMTVIGNGTYKINPGVATSDVVAPPPVEVTNTGYGVTQNNSQTVSVNQKIDMSAYGTNYAAAKNHFFYVVTINGDDIAFAPNDPAILTKTPPFRFYYIPGANSASDATAILMNGAPSFYNTGSPNFKSFRVNVADYTILEDAPESKFIFVATPVVLGTGIVNAQASTGPIFIDVDKSINRMILGAGRNQILDSNTTATTYIINSGMAPTDISASIQGFDLGSVNDTIDLTSFNGVTKLAVNNLTSFNNFSNSVGSSVKEFYNQYSYSGTVSFNANGKPYSIDVGTTTKDKPLDDFGKMLLARIVK